MTERRRPRLALHPHLLTRRLDAVVLACAPPASLAVTADIVRIEGTAGDVFAALQARPTVDELMRELTTRFGVDDARVRADVTPLLDGWRRAGIVVDVE